MTSVLIWERQRKIWHIKKKKRPCDHGGRNWSHAATNQGIPAATRSWMRQETLLELPEWSWPCWHLDFIPVILIPDCWIPELWENKFLLSHQVCGNFLQQPQYINTVIFLKFRPIIYGKNYCLCLSVSLSLSVSVSLYMCVCACICDSLEENLPKC